jgi:hypothetical protein
VAGVSDAAPRPSPKRRRNGCGPGAAAARSSVATPTAAAEPVAAASAQTTAADEVAGAYDDTRTRPDQGALGKHRRAPTTVPASYGLCAGPACLWAARAIFSGIGFQVAVINSGANTGKRDKLSKTSPEERCRPFSPGTVIAAPGGANRLRGHLSDSPESVAPPACSIDVPTGAMFCRRVT